MMYINRDFWTITQSKETSERKRPVIVLSVSSSYEYKIRERDAVVYALASKIEWYSGPLDHWDVITNLGDVEIELVSNDKSELERAISVVNIALDSCRA